MSPLSYGVAPFGAEPGRAHAADRRSTAPRQVKPGATLTMRVTPGEPSRVAVLAVDEGILQVARYKNPDPLGYFFQKRMLEVDTRQILDLILPDFKRFLALAAPGGDADGGFARHLNPFNQKAQAAGRVLVGRGRRRARAAANCATPCPTTSTAACASSPSAPARAAMGVAEAATEVKGDFILTPNVPAMAAPGDEFIVSVGVFNNTTGGERSDSRWRRSPAPGCRSSARRSVDLQIADKKEGVGEFRVKANAALGSAPLTFTARRGPAEARMRRERERAAGRRRSARS